MRIVLTALLMVLSITSAHTMSIEQAQRQAQALTERRPVEAPSDPALVPGYQPVETLSDDDAALQEAQENPAIHTLYQGVQRRNAERASVSEVLIERERAITQSVQEQESSECDPQTRDHYAFECDRAASSNTSATPAQQALAQNSEPPPFSLFQGEKQQCSRALAGLQNCCSDSPSYSQGCNNDDMELASARRQNLTHYVGRHCSRRVLGECLRRTYTYCTYSSKLERITAQQLHQQFNRSYGSSQNSTCQGFTPEDMEQAQLDDINLEEYERDIENAAQAPQGFDAPSMTRQTLDRVQGGRQ